MKVYVKNMKKNKKKTEKLKHEKIKKKTEKLKQQRIYV